MNLWFHSPMILSLIVTSIFIALQYPIGESHSLPTLWMMGIWVISGFLLLWAMPQRTFCYTSGTHVHTLWNISRSGNARSQWEFPASSDNAQMFSKRLQPFPFSESRARDFPSNVFLYFISPFLITNGVLHFFICLLTTGLLCEEPV